MTRALVTKEFEGVEDGKVYGRKILVGELIEGDLARVAIEEKWAQPEGAEKLAVAGLSAISADIGAAVAGQVGTGAKGAVPMTNASMAGKADGAGQSAPADKGAAAPVEIATDWKTLKWPDLKALAEKVSGGAVKDSAEAKSVIEAELARRSK